MDVFISSTRGSMSLRSGGIPGIPPEYSKSVVVTTRFGAPIRHVVRRPFER